MYEWMAFVRPDIPAANRERVIHDAFEWLRSDPRGQTVIGALADMTSLFDPIATAEGIAVRNLGLSILSLCGWDAPGKAVMAIMRGGTK